jgi:hypothetical protein
MAEHTPYQKKIINRYYDRRDEILLGRLQEIVTELYLVDSERKAGQLWKRAEKAMVGLNIPQAIRQHLLDQRAVEPLARSLRDWLDQARKKP